jgi:hypothetical protein
MMVAKSMTNNIIFSVSRYSRLLYPLTISAVRPPIEFPTTTAGVCTNSFKKSSTLSIKITGTN